jgi:hypothetical protein
VGDSVDLQLRERSADEEAEDVTEADPFDQIMCYGTGTQLYSRLLWLLGN